MATEELKSAMVGAPERRGIRMEQHSQHVADIASGVTYGAGGTAFLAGWISWDIVFGGIGATAALLTAWVNYYYRKKEDARQEATWAQQMKKDREG